MEKLKFYYALWNGIYEAGPWAIVTWEMDYNAVSMMYSATLYLFLVRYLHCELRQWLIIWLLSVI